MSGREAARGIEPWRAKGLLWWRASACALSRAVGSERWVPGQREAGLGEARQHQADDRRDSSSAAVGGGRSCGEGPRICSTAAGGGQLLWDERAGALRSRHGRLAWRSGGWGRPAVVNGLTVWMASSGMEPWGAPGSAPWRGMRHAPGGCGAGDTIYVRGGRRGPEPRRDRSGPAAISEGAVGSRVGLGDRDAVARGSLLPRVGQSWLPPAGPQTEQREAVPAALVCVSRSDGRQGWEAGAGSGRRRTGSARRGLGSGAGRREAGACLLSRRRHRLHGWRAVGRSAECTVAR